MTIYQLPAANTSGLDGMLVETAGAVPSFVPMFLFFIFGIIFITTFKKQKETGVGDAPLCSTIASVVTLIVSIMLSARTELMDILTLSIVVAITIFSGIWLFSSRDR